MQICKMNYIDTHAHLYLDAFNNDINKVIERSLESGVNKILLPNIDYNSINNMNSLSKKFPNECFSMIGLHPTSVKENNKEEFQAIKKEINLNYEKYIAIGEIGIDLHWDKTFFKEQQQIFKTQLEIAKELNFPVSIHTRDSFEETIKIVEEVKDITGVFHCFSETIENAKRCIDLGFVIGIGGVITFKNSNLPEVVKEVLLENIILETDAPFLAPMPYRGKRNESSYITIIAEKIAEIREIDINKVAKTTTDTAKNLFNL